MPRSAWPPVAATALFLIAGPARRGFAQIAVPGETPFLYGIDGPGGEALFEEKGKTGWIVFTETLGAAPADKAGRDYSEWTGRGHGAIVRLDGAAPNGALPCPGDYGAFASRAAAFVAASRGAHIWIVGNEMNLPAARPLCGGAARPVTPRDYAALFSRVRKAIRALKGRASDQVVPGAVSWTEQESSSDTLQFQIDLFEALGPGGADGAALHARTSGPASDLVFSEQKMTGAYSARHAQFRSYRDRVLALPPWARKLPIYITEAGPRSWTDSNTGWVRAAYAEIDAWNKEPGRPQIRALALYRWDDAAAPGTGIIGLLGVQKDLIEALDRNYQW